MLKDQSFCPACGARLEERALEGEGNVPFCAACGAFRFPQYNVAVSMIVRDAATGRILLIQQYGRPFYILVAGYVSRGEAAEDAVVREAEEGSVSSGTLPVTVTVDKAVAGPLAQAANAGEVALVRLPAGGAAGNSGGDGPDGQPGALQPHAVLRALQHADGQLHGVGGRRLGAAYQPGGRRLPVVRPRRGAAKHQARQPRRAVFERLSGRGRLGGRGVTAPCFCGMMTIMV